MIALEFTGQEPDQRMARAGYKAEKQLAFYLDRAFREEAYVRVFHGLRVERKGEAAQVDHLVLHRFGFVVVESKSIVESVIINKHGEFTRTYQGRKQGMPSPIAQAQRQIDLLQLLLNEQKTELRRTKKLGPIKIQCEFGDLRFKIIAAISDRGCIEGQRPPQVMKAEAVVADIQKHIDYQASLVGFGGFARSVFADFTDKKKARERDENQLDPFTDEEMESITSFLLAEHKPKTSQAPSPAPTMEQPAAPAKLQPQPAATPQQPTAASSEAPPARPSYQRNMARWTPDEEIRLKQAFAAGDSPESLAKSFGRTPKALRLRAQRLGLIADPAEWR